VIYRIRVRSLRSRSEQLEILVAQRTADLQDAKESLEWTNERLQQANSQLEKMVLLDPLTGLANRRHFESALESEWRRAQRSGEPLSLLQVDVDHFKLFNDTYGHPEGDECLRRVAQALRSTFRRAGDLVARVGGEEFAVLLPGTPRASAEVLAAQMIESIDRLAVEHRSSPDSRKLVTVSAGVSTITASETTQARDLVSAADAALYVAKQGGRHRWAGQDVTPAEGLPVV
jgi:diguanylate cyclase (GGDEF)-like protein